MTNELINKLLGLMSQYRGTDSFYYKLIINNESKYKLFVELNK